MAKLELAISRLVSDEEVYRLTQEELFEPEFAAFCKRTKESSTANLSDNPIA